MLHIQQNVPEMDSYKLIIDKSKESSSSSCATKQKKFTTSFRRWLLWIPLVIFGSILYVFDFRGELHYHIPVPHAFIPVSEKPVIPMKSGFLVNTPGCRIPYMDPFDPIVRKFIKKEKLLNCFEKHPLLVDSNSTSIFILESAFPAFNISDADQLQCCYQPFWRSPPKEQVSDNKIILSANCTPFTDSVLIEDDFVKVKCSVDNQEIYKTYHSFIHLKPELEKRCQEAKENSSTDSQVRLSVLMIGLDAVSRVNFHRQMPKTNAMLRNIEAIEMLGYNKVADNTFPNLVPVLSGLREEELKPCWPDASYVFDNCSWIWSNFSMAGYRTAYCEDAAWMGLFSYQKQGFKKQPTDYYCRPFMTTAEDDIGHKRELNAKLCIGSKMSTEVLLNYTLNYANTMAFKDSISLFWSTSLTHDYLNYPNLGDELFEELITDLLAKNSLNKTLLIFMSDHGIRWGDIRQTYQGRLEERLPLLFFVFPKWFKDLYPAAVANLRKNAVRLSTPFDLHKTLLDILDVQQISQESIRERTKELDSSKKKPRGISLFLPIHKQRTCVEAGIDMHWCTCQNSKVLPTGDSTVQNMSIILVKHLNSLLKPYGDCSVLELATVKSASVEFPLEHITDKATDQGLKDYILVVQTVPGDALFEATVRLHLGNSSTEVVGAVSRINTYGSQSSCVSDYHMKLYCYCKSYLKSRTKL